MKQEIVYTLEYFLNIEDPEYPHFTIGVSKSADNALTLAKKYLREKCCGAIKIYAFTTNSTAFDGHIINILYSELERQ